MTLDERIEIEIEKNPELKEIFEKYPERKELYRQKIIDSENASSAVVERNPKYCKTCVFRKGKPPFADSPMKAYCAVYTREIGIQKPDSVYYDGEECKYYMEDSS